MDSSAVPSLFLPSPTSSQYGLESSLSKHNHSKPVPTNEPQSSSFGQSPSSNPHLKECKKECVDWLIYNMTVSYHLDIATTGTFAFFKVLLRWRSSIWKRTLVDMVAWIAVYSLVSVFYRLVLFGRGQLLVSKYFETLAHYLDTHLGMFPVNLILGFFVMIVFKRWEGIFNNIGLIDDCAYNVSAYIPGDDPEITMLRRNILRYICLSQVLVLRDVSMSVKLRFPNMAAVEDAGYLQNEELNILMRNGKGYDKKYWVPLVWANQLIMKLAAEKKFLVNLLCCICLG